MCRRGKIAFTGKEMKALKAPPVFMGSSKSEGVLPTRLGPTTTLLFAADGSSAVMLSHRPMEEKSGEV